MSSLDFPPLPPAPPKPPTLRIVETAFFASMAALIWLLGYTPLGPLVRLFYSIPVALGVMRWDPRTGAMTLVVSTLLISILMGPTRSVLYVIPYGLIGLWCGLLWWRRLNWYVSLLTGAALSTLGFIFQFLLGSILVGENLWAYLTIQLTGLANWLLELGLGWLGIHLIATPWVVQLTVIGFIAFNSLLYVFTVHLVAALAMERLRCPLPTPPNWVQFLLD